MSETGEIGQNAPNEANFDECLAIVETQGLIQVRAVPATLSGLDKGGAQTREDGASEQGEAQGSAAESGDPKPQTPDSSDRACGGSSPAMDSKREKRRSRLQKERRAVERMVEYKLKAGNFAPGEILMTALAMAPAVRDLD